MALNVLASWGGYLVYIVAGFIMPRMIDRHVGQTALGVWDFGWSIIGYFQLAQLGVGSSVNRYIAKYRAIGDRDGLRRTVASVQAVQLVAAAVVALSTLVLFHLLPTMFGRRLGGEAGTAQWVLLFLGFSIAVQMAFDTYRGVITGCHRWDLHNWINSGFYAVSVSSMMVVLTLGGGLQGIAATYLCGVVLTELARALVAYRVCPGLPLGLSGARWLQARRMIVFGGKRVIDNLGRLLLTQSNSVLVGAFLGPAALAVYSRPSALTRHVETLVNKFAFVLTPAASSLQSNRQHDELRRLFLQSARIAGFMVLPLGAFLTILGSSILTLWMGARYNEGVVIGIMSLGIVMPLVQSPATHILIGMNMHGRVGWASLVVALCALGCAGLAISAGVWRLELAAVAVALPQTVGTGIFVPIYACRRLKIPFHEYLRVAFVGPIGCVVPFAACLVVIRYVFASQPAVALLAGAGAGIAVLGPLYWRVVMPASVKDRLGWLLRLTGPLRHTESVVPGSDPTATAVYREAEEATR